MVNREERISSNSNFYHLSELEKYYSSKLSYSRSHLILPITRRGGFIHCFTKEETEARWVWLPGPGDPVMAWARARTQFCLTENTCSSPYGSDLTQTLPPFGVQPCAGKPGGKHSGNCDNYHLLCFTNTICCPSPKTQQVRHSKYSHFTERKNEAQRLEQTM